MQRLKKLVSPMAERDQLAELRAPFPIDDIEWRIQQAGLAPSGPWAMVIPYITNRAIQNRLDDVFGFDWENKEPVPTPDGKGWLCGISVKIKGEWITRWDGAENTQIESLKGGLSGSMKRAGAQFGIGRYLYQLDEAFAICKEVKARRESKHNYQYVKPGKRDTWKAFGMDWETPGLPIWAFPTENVQPFKDAITESGDLDALKEAYTTAYKYASNTGDESLLTEFTRLKDKVKDSITKGLALNLQENLKEVSVWLNRQVETYSLVPNMASVTQLHKTVEEDLDVRCKNQMFDTKPLYDLLMKAYSKRKSELTQEK